MTQNQTPHHHQYHLTRADNAGLSYALGGRPFELLMLPGALDDPRLASVGYTADNVPAGAVALLRVSHENGQHHVDLWCSAEDLELSAPAFEERRTKPMIHNLDNAAYPERWERLMPALKAYAEVVAQTGDKS